MTATITKHANGIFTLDDFFTPAECAAEIERCEAMGFRRASIHTSGGQELVVPGVRNNDRVIWDDPAYAAAIWERLMDAIDEGPEGQPPIGLNERWRFYRYEPGQRFKRHRDGSVVLPPREVDGRRLPMGRSLTTFMVYLNADFTGGETAFYHEDGEEIVCIRPRTGTALCFRHDIKHEGCLVTEGRKYVLRTDIMYAP